MFFSCSFEIGVPRAGKLLREIFLVMVVEAILIIILLHKIIFQFYENIKLKQSLSKV
jgi:hypothetical protein